MARKGKGESLATRLYRGEVSWDFIGRRRRWYALSGLVMLIGILSLAIQGLNPSIDFKGGAEFQGPLNGHSITQVKSVVSGIGVNPDVSQVTGSGSDQRFNIETATLTNDSIAQVEQALATEVGVANAKIDITTVGSTWGSEITHKAVEGLIIFLVAVSGYLSIRFEWKMALAAMIALLHDLVITAGIYSLSGLQVSPSTVIALLTILGYSLYDTVVVFDKVRENTAGIAGGSKMTFSQATNLAVNQTLVRSINTSIIALLPVLGLLVIGAGLLGAGSLDDLSVALFIGLASGAYSSIFIASPLLCDFKEREPTYQQLAKRVASRRIKEASGVGALEPATVGAPLAVRTSSVAPAAPAPEVRRPIEAGDSGPSEPAEDRLEPADDELLDVPVVERRQGVPPRTGARPTQQRRRSTRGGRPGGRGGKSRKRR
ncbi:MAG TPA: protein translocase subunit SecF [Mycobacteriales bacterium]|jgi:preprotein translocase subunit SecF|nr:protein translocase subunit SecF [Mycobacteriales bacterium]